MLQGSNNLWKNEGVYENVLAFVKHDIYGGPLFQIWQRQDSLKRFIKMYHDITELDRYRGSWGSKKCKSCVLMTPNNLR